MKTLKTLIILAYMASNPIKGQNLQTIKTYYDPHSKTQLEEVYTVLPNTPTKHGNYKRYDKGGTLVEEATLSRNQINGFHKVYYGSEWNLPNDYLIGKIHIVETYTNGILTGLSEQYQYVDNKKCFLWQKTYNNKGEVIKEVTYYETGVKSASIQANGICTEWYENGQKSAEFANKNEKMDGQYTSWYEDGKLMGKATFSAGNFIGKGVFYFPDGKIQVEKEYDNRSLLTMTKEYFSDGKVKYERYAIEGSKFKELTYDSLSGNKLSDIDLIMINPDSNPELIISGKKLIYYSSGKVMAEEYYNNGQKIGTWKKYHEGGELKEVVNYDN